MAQQVTLHSSRVPASVSSRVSELGLHFHVDLSGFLSPHLPKTTWDYIVPRCECIMHINSVFLVQDRVVNENEFGNE